MLHRLFFLCFLATTSLWATAEDINLQVRHGNLYGALTSILFVDNIATHRIENPILRRLREISEPWSLEQGQIFLNRLPEHPTISVIQAALTNLDGPPRRTLTETGKPAAFHRHPFGGNSKL